MFAVAAIRGLNQRHTLRYRARSAWGRLVRQRFHQLPGQCRIVVVPGVVMDLTALNDDQLEVSARAPGTLEEVAVLAKSGQLTGRRSHQDARMGKAVAIIE